MEYYGIVTNITQEEVYPFRHRVEFEIESLSRVEMFLNEDQSVLKSTNDDTLRTALDAFFTHGTDSEEFGQKKLAYLGNGSYKFLYLYVEDASFNRFSFSKWYRIVIGETDRSLEYEILDPFDPNENVTEKGKCIVEDVDSHKQNTLIKLFKPITACEGLVQGGIEQDTEIGCVSVYYMGAALCVLLEKIPKNGGIMIPVCIFDLGAKPGKTSIPAVSSKSDIVLDNIEYILSLAKSCNFTVVISHWHDDHYCIVTKHMNEPEYDVFFKNSSWHVPEESCPSALGIKNRVVACGGQWTSYREAEYKNLNDCKNVKIGKINLDGDHPHHKGIFLSATKTQGLSILLVGDSTYEGVTALIDQERFDYLQACHHGGNYALAPFDRKDRSKFIPSPKLRGAPEAIYSANGFKHGHPNKIYVSEHKMKGWGSIMLHEPSMIKKNGFTVKL